MRTQQGWIRVLLGGVLACLLLASPAGATPARPAQPAHLVADRIRSTPDGVVAEGNVAIDLQGARLLCQHLQMDRATGALTARGECVFYWQDSFIAADTLTWDPATRSARMLRAAGQGRDFNVEGGALDRDLFFWAEQVDWTEAKVDLRDATFTTCDTSPGDWHYDFHSDHVEIYPNQQLLAANASLALHGRRIATLPTLNLSLDPQDRRRRRLIPQIGSNSSDGLFVRSSLDYAFDRSNYGNVLLDFYSRTGVGRGLEHFYTLGDKGEGSFYVYQKDGIDDRQRYEVRNLLNYRPDDHTWISWDLNSNRAEIPGMSYPDNLSSVVSASRATSGSILHFSHNYNESGYDTNTTWRMYYNLQLTPELSTVWSADLATASTRFARTERFHYVGSLRHVGELFDSELAFENSSGQRTFFMNRNPELTVRSRPLHLGSVPLLASASFGQVQESPSMFQTQRYDLKLQVPDQTLEYDSGRLMLGGGLRQLCYGTGESQYVLAARAGWLQHLGEMGTLRLDYNWQLPEGFTPFQHDFSYPYENLTGGLELSRADQFSLAILGGYDLRSNQFHQIMPRVDVRPGPNLHLTAASSYDPNTSVWRNVDAGVKMQLTPGLSVSHWGVYDLVNSRLTYQDYQINYEDHDSVTSLVYRGVQNEFYLQFSLKAFPLQPVNIGPNANDPIMPNSMRYPMPYSMPNAFAR